MSQNVRRSVGDGTTWPPKAVAAQVDDTETVIYDPANHAAHVRSVWSIPAGEYR